MSSKQSQNEFFIYLVKLEKFTKLISKLSKLNNLRLEIGLNEQKVTFLYDINKDVIEVRLGIYGDDRKLYYPANTELTKIFDLVSNMEDYEFNLAFSKFEQNLITHLKLFPATQLFDKVIQKINKLDEVPIFKDNNLLYVLSKSEIFDKLTNTRIFINTEIERDILIHKFLKETTYWDVYNSLNIIETLKDFI
jgi:hypothetical protein